MVLILLEALGALLALVLIVWWTMFSGRSNGESRSAANQGWHRRSSTGAQGTGGSRPWRPDTAPPLKARSVARVIARPARASRAGQHAAFSDAAAHWPVRRQT